MRVRVEGPAIAGAEPFERRLSVQADGAYGRSDLPTGQATLQLVRFVKGLPTGADPWTVVEERTCTLAAGEKSTVDFLLAP